MRMSPKGKEKTVFLPPFVVTEPFYEHQGITVECSLAKNDSFPGCLGFESVKPGRENCYYKYGA